MTLPTRLREEVEAALTDHAGRSVRIASAQAVGGGCVSPVARVDTRGGERFFLKWSAPGHPAGLLGAEARGLRLLAATHTVRVPDVVAAASDDAWLLLEWIEPGPAAPDAWRRLGGDLAALHRVRGETFGAEAANFIGPLPQPNDPAGSWAGFWRSRRLEPQLRRAVDGGLLTAEDRARLDRLLATLDDLLDTGDHEGASTLHGDLWSGNVHMPAEGSPAVIDPSAYHGHREVDLAMAELFGGFAPEFRRAYDEAWPLEPGYAPVRRATYQLYYLLVHVNLFGAGYLGGCRRAIQEAGF